MPATQPVNTSDVAASGAGTSYQDPTINPGAFGGQIGEAMTRVGQEAAQQVQQVQGLINETHANDLSTAYMKKLGDLKGDFFSKSGQDAVAAAPQYQQDILDLRNDTLSQANSNPDLKKMLGVDVARQTNYALLEIGQHVDQQAKVASVASSLGRIDQWNASGIQARNNPQQLAVLAAQVAGESTKISEVKGLPPDAALSDAANERGKFWQTVITAKAVQDNDPLSAKAMFDANAKDMDAVSQEKTAEFLAPKVLNAQAVGIGTAAYAAAPKVSGPAVIPDQYKDMIFKAAMQTGVPSQTIAATIQHESNWHFDAVNKTSGAIGGGQILPSTARNPGFNMQGVDPASLTDPEANINFTAQYLAARGKNAGVTDWEDPAQAKKGYAAYYSGAPGNTARYAETSAALQFGPDKAGNVLPVYSEADLGGALQRGHDMVAKMFPNGGAPPELLDRVDAEIRKQHQDFMGATQADRTALGKDLDNIQAALQDGRTDVSIPTSRIYSLLPPEQAEPIVQKLQDAQAYGVVASKVKNASESEIQDMVKSIGNPADKPTDIMNYANRDKQERMLQAALKQRDAQMNDDPAAYAFKNSPVVSAAFANLQKNPKDPQAQIAYNNAQISEQTRYGVAPADQSVITKPQAAFYAQRIVGLDPAGKDGNASAQLQGLQQQYGAQWPAVFKAIATQGKLPDQYKTLAAMPPGTPAQTDFQNTLNFIATNKSGMRGLEEYATTGNIKAGDVDKALASDPDLTNFHASTALKSAGIELSNQVQSSVRMLALYYAGTGRAQDGESAVKMASDGILGQKYDFVGGARVPSGMAASFSSAASAKLDGLTADDIDMSKALPRDFLGATDRASMLQAAKAGRWVTNSSDDGVALMGNFKGRYLPMRGKDGQPIGFKFTDIPAINANVQNAAPNIDDPAG